MEFRQFREIKRCTLTTSLEQDALLRAREECVSDLKVRDYRIRTLSRLIGERADLFPHEAETGTDFRKLL